MDEAEDSRLQGQIDELVARLASSDRHIQGLEGRADTSDVRADASDHRADVSEDRADVAQVRVDGMEVRLQIDREMIAELQAEGLLSQKHAAELDQALISSRIIGAAIGVLMASRGVSQDDAFKMLKEASQRSNRKLRDLAAELVERTSQGVLL